VLDSDSSMINSSDVELPDIELSNSNIASSIVGVQGSDFVEGGCGMNRLASD
jgi:hypothetical protein